MGRSLYENANGAWAASAILGFRQNHVRNQRGSHGAAFGVGEIHRASTKMGSHAEHARAGQQLAFGHGTEIVDLQIDRGDAAEAAALLMDGEADGGIGEGGVHASVNASEDVAQVVVEIALYAKAVFMQPRQAHSEQLQKRRLRHALADLSGGENGLGQKKF